MLASNLKVHLKATLVLFSHKFILRKTVLAPFNPLQCRACRRGVSGGGGSLVTVLGEGCNNAQPQPQPLPLPLPSPWVLCPLFQPRR